MRDTEGLEPVRCASYTFARRHPKVLGKIGGWAPPVQPTFTQIGVFTGTFVVLWKTWGLWSSVLPLGFLQLLVIIGGPAGAAWAVRRSRFEGRSLPRSAVALLSYAARPPAGWVSGKPQRNAGSVTDWRNHRVWIGAPK